MSDYGTIDNFIGCAEMPSDMQYDAKAALERIIAHVAQLEQHILMLTKLPAWEPVAVGFTHLCECIDCTGEDPDAWGWQLYVNNGGIGIEDPDNKDDGRWVKLPDDLRLCRFTPAADWVDWEKVPPGYDWVAADGNGDLFAYTLAPKRQPAYWSCRSTQMKEVPGELPLGIDWRQSLRRRPGSEEE